MTHCDLIWYSDETYTEVLDRAVKLAREHDQVVTIHDPVSGRAVRIVTPHCDPHRRRLNGR